MGWVSGTVRERLLAQTSQLWGAPGVIDLGIGQPQDALLPAGLLGQVPDDAARGGGVRYPLQYGLERGDGRLRVALAEFLSGPYGAPVDPDLMMISNGNSQAIDLCCATLTEPGDVVLVEDPTYFLALRIFRDHGVRVVGVPLDDGGMRLDALAEAIERHRPTLIYTIPAAHNPTGVSLAEDRRDALVALAAEHGVLVVADEVYQLLQYAGEAPRPLANRIGAGNVISLGTFSKILAPGLRLGWIQAAEPLLQRLEARGTLASGGGLNPFTSAIVAPALEDGSVAQYLEHVVGVFRGRVAVMDGALRREVPGARYAVPDAGYFFWVRLDGVDTAALRPRALERGAGFHPGSVFSVGGGFTDHLRLSFAYYGAEEIERAVAAIGRAVAL